MRRMFVMRSLLLPDVCPVSPFRFLCFDLLCDTACHQSSHCPVRASWIAIGVIEYHYRSFVLPFFVVVSRSV